MTDDQDGSESLSTAPPRRIPVYVSVLVVLACGLIGYGLSLAVPLHRGPTPAAPAAAVAKPEPPADPAPNPAKGAQATPARQDASYAGAGGNAAPAGRQTAAPEKPPSPTPAAALDPPARLGRVAPTAAPSAKTPASAPAPAVETGSVEHSPQRAVVPPGDKSATPADAPVAARTEPQGEAAGARPDAKQAQPAPRKRVRRVYRPRAQPKTAKGPFEQLFPALAK